MREVQDMDQLALDTVDWRAFVITAMKRLVP
jgi:hypothetical protein